jgi:hypothetical protein
VPGVKTAKTIEPVSRQTVFDLYFPRARIAGVVPPPAPGSFWQAPKRPRLVDNFIFQMTPAFEGEARESGFGKLRDRDKLLRSGIACPYHAARAGVYLAAVEADLACAQNAEGRKGDIKKALDKPGAYLERVSVGEGIGLRVPTKVAAKREALRKSIGEAALEAHQLAKVDSTAGNEALAAAERRWNKLRRPPPTRRFAQLRDLANEADYLANYRDARVIAPGESYEMTDLGGRYRSALRASGLPAGENDVGNVLRIMDELGLKSGPEREHFLNSFLKSQQAFGSQISTETALAAYRNAKQSIYGWSPEFREKYFPTLLQCNYPPPCHEAQCLNPWGDGPQ